MEIECTKCKKIKSLDGFYKRKGSKCGYRRPCIECYNNKDICKWRVYSKEYWKEYRQRDKSKKTWRKWFLKRRENITDSYIKKLLTSRSNLRFEDIPQELVEAKRQYVKIKRITKETQNENR